MTKKFDKDSIIAWDGFTYLVDKETVTNKTARYWVSSEDGIGRIVNHLDTSKFGWPVVTCNNLSVDVPQIKLPSLETEAEDKAKKACHRFRHTPAYQAIYTAWLDGYFEAAKAKKYDEKDIHAAISMAREISFKGYEVDDGFISKYSNDEILKSLTKPIKSITIEMDDRKEVENYYKDGLISNSNFGKPKVGYDGYVIIKEVEWE